MTGRISKKENWWGKSSWITEGCEESLGQLKRGTRTKNKRIFGGQHLSQDKDMSCGAKVYSALGSWGAEPLAAGVQSCGKEQISSEWQVPWEADGLGGKARSCSELLHIPHGRAVRNCNGCFLTFQKVLPGFVSKITCTSTGFWLKLGLETANQKLLLAHLWKTRTENRFLSSFQVLWERLYFKGMYRRSAGNTGFTFPDIIVVPDRD